MHSATVRSAMTMIKSGIMAIALCCAIAFAQAAQVCEFQLVDCPEAFNGDTIVVPDNVIALSSNIHAYKSSVVFQDLAGSARVSG